jgi:hypothetical protein
MFAVFQGSVRASDVFKGVRVRDFKLQRAVAESLEQVGCPRAHLGLRRHVISEAGTGEEKRPGLAELYGIHAADGASDGAVADHEAAPSQAPERAGERGPANRIEHDIDAHAIRKPLDLIGEVDLVVTNYLIDAERGHALSFLRRTHGGEDLRPRCLRELGNELANAPRRSVDQAGGAWAEPGYIADKVMGGTSGEYEPSRVDQIYLRWNRGREPGGHSGVLGVAPPVQAPGDAVAHRCIGHSRADINDAPRALDAERGGQPDRVRV